MLHFILNLRVKKGLHHGQGLVGGVGVHLVGLSGVTRERDFPDELGRVVEGPLELDLGRVGLHAADNVHQLIFRDPVNDGVRIGTDGNI